MSEVDNQSIVTSVAFKIAEEAVPDEIDLAPAMTLAFIEGGQAREELFRKEQGSQVGGFGSGGLIALFPIILRVLSQNALAVYQFLTTDAASLLGLLNDLLDLPSKLKRADTIKALPKDAYEPLKTVINTLSYELEASGLPPEQADLITFRVVRSLLNSPRDSVVFIESIKQERL